MSGAVVACAVMSGTQAACCDCPGHAICVTSLNMRKWMRDRLQRRKKKTPEQGSQPAPPPLQPAYFDADQASDVAPQSRQNEVEVQASEPEFEAAPAHPESAPIDVPEQPRRSTSAGESQSGRGRRRRGGRGRGGRGREQGVAQALGPSAAKGG